MQGSVPVFWEQKMVRGKHRTSISRGPEATEQAFKLHFTNQIKRYGKHFVINLLGTNENEKIISEAFEEQLKRLNSPEIQYKAFDFHEHLGSSGLKFNMIGPLLLDELQPSLLKFGIYVRDDRNAVIMEQHGVFRTNCLDCLDR